MLARIMRALLRVFRWRIDGEVPPHPKMVLIGAPHTSNWDFPLAMVAAPALGLRIRWLGKHTLFRKPFGWFFRMLGGIPVDRARASGLMRQAVEMFEGTDRLTLVITPSGSRSVRDHWKSGFYHIARGAEVPIVMIGVDGANRTLVVGGDFVPTGDLKADMDRVRAFYGPYRGIKPAGVGPIRLREEE